MRRFVIGAIFGGLLMYGYIHYGPGFRQSGEQWIGGTASGYRGDRTHERARDALK